MINHLLKKGQGKKMVRIVKIIAVFWISKHLLAPSPMSSDKSLRGAILALTGLSIPAEVSNKVVLSK